MPKYASLLPHLDGREHHSIAEVDVEFEDTCFGAGVAVTLSCQQVILPFPYKFTLSM